jgi:outer membrane protein assembly factor BamB
MTNPNRTFCLTVAMLLTSGGLGRAQQPLPTNKEGPLQYRTWTDSTGRYQTEAAMVDYKDGTVHLRKRDGRTAIVPRLKLSAADQRYLREELARRRARARVRPPEPGRMTTPIAKSEWPGWRGPQRDGKSPDTGLLKEWPPAGPPLLWQVNDLGKGYSSVAVAGGMVYTTGDMNGELVVRALDMNGKTQWTVNHDAAWTKSHPGSRSTPMIDGGRLYIESGNGVVGCYDAKTGRPQWGRDLRELGGSVPGWGYSESVLILDNLAVVTPGGQNCIVALNKTSGQPVWASQGFSAGAQYGSCYTFTYQGVPMIVAGTHGGIVCVDARNGQVLWSNRFSERNTANCPTPVFSDGHVVWANGYGKGGICLRLQVAGGRVHAQEAWRTRDLDCHHGGFIVHEGHVYGNHGNTWVCLDLKTGQKMWQERAVGKGSICFADGMLYLFGESGGKAGLATCSPRGMEMKGEFSVRGEGPSWAHPVVIGGRLYLRYDNNLYCYDVRAS